jgi:hypothetical protein
MTSRSEWLANERKTDAEVKARAGGKCEACHGSGDYRGLAIHHSTHRGMGGTRHIYTALEKQLLCYPCHSAMHNIKEVKA